MYERALRGYEEAPGPTRTSPLATVNNLGSFCGAHSRRWESASQHRGGAGEFLLEAGKRARFVAKRPDYGRCAPRASQLTGSDTRQHAGNNR
jgi:hypothetical protein